MFETINHFALMRLFGGADQLARASRRDVQRALLYLLGDHEAQQAQEDRINDQAKATERRMNATSARSFGSAGAGAGAGERDWD